MRSGGMRWQTTKGRSASVWQKLASALALLATALFMAHGAMAESLVRHAHVQNAAHTGHMESSPNTRTLSADPAMHHMSSVAAAEPGVGEHGTLACCGKACVAALLPDQAPCLEKPRGGDQKSPVLASLLTGSAPEGPRRPPRTSI